jgi:hypothetical protein
LKDKNSAKELRDDSDWELQTVMDWGVPREAAHYWDLADFYDPKDDHTYLAANVEGRVASWSDLSAITGIMGGFAMEKAGTDLTLGSDMANDCYAILIAIAISLLTSATVILSVMIWTVRRALAHDEYLATSGVFDVFADKPESERKLKFLRGMGANMLLQTYLGESWDKRGHFGKWPGLNANWFQPNLLWWSKCMFCIGMFTFLAAATMEHQGSVDQDGSWPQVVVVIIMCLPLAGGAATMVRYLISLAIKKQNIQKKEPAEKIKKKNALRSRIQNANEQEKWEEVRERVRFELEEKDVYEQENFEFYNPGARTVPESRHLVVTPL